jgi:hypothetical protein
LPTSTRVFCSLVFPPLKRQNPPFASGAVPRCEVTGTMLAREHSELLRSITCQMCVATDAPGRFGSLTLSPISLLPPSRSEHPAAELSVDAAQLCKDPRQADQIALLPTWLRARPYPPLWAAFGSWGILLRVAHRRSICTARWVGAALDLPLGREVFCRRYLAPAPRAVMACWTFRRPSVRGPPCRYLLGAAGYLHPKTTTGENRMR